ncbi:hypothetical protein [Streptomyces anulatus]|uniref:hypothetical protein n=1 Tax=Streptomyces anulatus TaxID=1892 RepID=UPI00342CE1A2
MGTSGSFVPATVPECPYAPRMTRAAAQALAAGGGLRENCVVVITDGPTIGTAGNTSTTEIELNPVSATAFGQTARVFSSFAPEAWPGVYDLAGNRITELRDDFGNTAKDLDAGSATVHTQWPWHLGSATLRDNYAEDAVLTGFPGTGAFTNNRVVESTLDFTGKTAGTVNQSTFLGSTVTSGAASLTATRLEMTGSTVANSGTGPVTFTSTEIEGTANALVLQATDTAGASISGCQWVSGGAGFRINLNRTAGGLFSAAACLFQGGSGDPLADLRIAGTGLASLSACQILVRGGGGANSMFVIDGPGTFQLTRARISDIGGTSVGITKDVASTGSLQITEAELIQGRIVHTGAGALGISSGSRLTGSVITHGGAGALTISGVRGSGNTITMAPTSTRGLQLIAGHLDGSTITQNGTGNTNADIFGSGSTGFNGQRATVTLNNTGAAQPSDTYQGLTMQSGATLTAANPGGATNPVNNSTLGEQSTLNLTAGGTFVRSRLGVQATVNTGFAVIASIAEGFSVAVTTTADNLDRLANKSFNDWV